MGGRGSGGGKTGGGGGAAAKKELKETTKTQAKTETKKQAKEQPKEKTLQEKRLEALAKARAKRQENLKNGIKPTKKPKVSVDSAAYDLKSSLLRNVDSDGYLRSSDFRTERNSDGSIDLDIRYLGKWKNPSYARHEEDYDWQELTPKSKKQISKVIKTIQKQTKRKITCDGSEKNWLSFHIE